MPLLIPILLGGAALVAAYFFLTAPPGAGVSKVPQRAKKAPPGFDPSDKPAASQFHQFYVDGQGRWWYARTEPSPRWDQVLEGTYVSPGAEGKCFQPGPKAVKLCAEQEKSGNWKWVKKS